MVGVGMAEGPEGGPGPGAVYIVSRHDGEWTGERIDLASALVHGVCMGDPAIELVAASFSGNR